MNKTRLVIIPLLAVLVLGSLAYGVTPANAAPAAPSDYAIVTLNAPPLSSYTGTIWGYAATMPAPGQKLDLTSPAAISYSNYLAAQHGNVKAYLAQIAPQVHVIYEYSTVLNGLAVKLNGYNLDHLTGLPGI